MNKKLLRLGTTSYILFDDILPNVRYLGPLVDDIELVLFESEQESNLPSPQVVSELRRLSKEHGLSYTVHFPLDIYPGSCLQSERQRCVDTIRRIVDLTRELDSYGYVLHLTPDLYGTVPSENVPRWLDNLDATLASMLKTLDIDSRQFCVETLSYPFSFVLPLVERYDLSVTLDIGHIWLMGYNREENLSSLLPRTRICHLHGVHQGKDHLSLEKGDKADIEAFLVALRRQISMDQKERVLTLEVFNEEDFLSSLSLIQESHAMMGPEWRGADGYH